MDWNTAISVKLFLGKWITYRVCYRDRWYRGPAWYSGAEWTTDNFNDFESNTRSHVSIAREDGWGTRQLLARLLRSMAGGHVFTHSKALSYIRVKLKKWQKWLLLKTVDLLVRVLRKPLDVYNVTILWIVIKLISNVIMYLLLVECNASFSTLVLTPLQQMFINH